MVHWNLQDNQGHLHPIAIHDVPCVSDPHMNFFLHNIEANKQTITFHMLMVYACSSCQMNANFFGKSGNLSIQFHWIPITIPLAFICHQS